LLEYLDRTVRTTTDVESFLGVPVLEIVPPLKRVRDGNGKGGPSPADEPVRTVLFSSPGPAEGKSTTALNFALMLAQQGQRVLLLEADLRRPAPHRAPDAIREPGLTNLLAGDAKLREAVRPNVRPNPDFMPCGSFPPNPCELLNSRAMERLLEEMEGRYDPGSGQKSRLERALIRARSWMD
jgi:Mrp family chromosome partitioning ATPase